ncbi:hypothetical protein [Streptomyces lunalinharesii]
MARRQEKNRNEASAHLFSPWPVRAPRHASGPSAAHEVAGRSGGPASSHF